MNKAEVCRCLVFGDKVYLKGDIVKIYIYDCIGNYVSYTGRIYIIDDLNIYIDTSRPYNSETRSFATFAIQDIEEVKEND